MGGIGAHEYMAPCAAGENEVALSDAGYAANVEIASADAAARRRPARAARRARARGDARRDDDRGRCPGMLGVPAGRADQGVAGDRGRTAARCSCSCAATTASTRSSSRTRSARPSRPAEAEEVRELFGAEPGFIGPVGAQVRRCWPTRRCAASRGLVAGANEPDMHLRGVEPGRDFEPDWADVRARRGRATRRPSGAEIRIEPAIEVGNIFKLGTRYSEPLGARYLDEQGKEQLDLDGLLRHRPGARSWRPRSSSSPTSRASRGRARSRPSTSSW